MPSGMVIVSEDRCKGCGLCVGFCPQEILQMAQGRFNVKGHHPVEVTDPDACTGCTMCATICPDVVFTVYRRRRPSRRAARIEADQAVAGA